MLTILLFNFFLIYDSNQILLFGTVKNIIFFIN